MSDLVVSTIPQVRDSLVQRREEIRALHAGGATGSQVVAALTVMVDGVVARLAATAASELDATDAAVFESGVALVALGGYGRAELAPYSDVDLMFLYQPDAKEVVDRIGGRLVRDFWDVRLVLGSSMRTLTECLALARRDVTVHTALLEARHVVGNQWLTGELRDRLTRLCRGSRGDRYIAAALADRAAEQAKAGANVHLLEPDVKRSRGGLRELHLLRWVAQMRHGVTGIDRLEREGHLSAEDAEVLRSAREFLLRIRNEMHFHAGRAQETLTWDEQSRLAQVFGYQNRPGLLAVEQFMQQYYRHSTAIDDLTDRFVRRCRRPSLWRRLTARLRTQHVSGEYCISGNRLAPLPQALPEILGSLERVVQLFALAKRHKVMVADEVREQIRVMVPRLETQDRAAPRRILLQILAEPGHLAPTLRQLHSLAILQMLIPEFGHARGLIQFNQYHKYTIDEHTLLCIANAEQYVNDTGPVGQVYRQIRHKEILHLALLLHDLGKGFEQDHSELGGVIAQQAAERFSLEPHLGELLVFLVRYHLLMAHLAFRRDTSDEKLLTHFARQVGTPEVLRMLFVLTAADIASVGPGTWTTWKAEVLCELYARTIEKLSGQAPTMNPQERIGEVREQVTRTLNGAVPAEWLSEQLAAMTPSYLLGTPIERIAEHLTMIFQLSAQNVIGTATYDAQRHITAYTVYTFDDITPGLFSKIAGVLAAKGLQILSAQITTLTNGVVVDRFEVLDYDYAGEPPKGRLVEVTSTIGQVLRAERTIESVFAQSNRIGPRYQPQPDSMREPPQVKIDNETSEGSTIIEVFADDRQGLLYVITRTIFELNLSVSLAKIATSLDQVLDVFYVTDQSGRKVTEPARLDHIQSCLVGAIEAFEKQGRKSAAG